MRVEWFPLLDHGLPLALVVNKGIPCLIYSFFLIILVNDKSRPRVNNIVYQV